MYRTGWQNTDQSTDLVMQTNGQKNVQTDYKQLNQLQRQTKTAIKLITPSTAPGDAVLVICALRALLNDIADNGQTVRGMLNMVRLRLKRGVKLPSLVTSHEGDCSGSSKK